MSHSTLVRRRRRRHCRRQPWAFVPLSHKRRRHPRRRVYVGHAGGTGRPEEQEGDGGQVAFVDARPKPMGRLLRR